MTHNISHLPFLPTSFVHQWQNGLNLSQVCVYYNLAVGGRSSYIFGDLTVDSGDLLDHLMDLK
jgi:hypothetical protein